MSIPVDVENKIRLKKEKLDKLKSLIKNIEDRKEKRWCKTHPAGFWGKKSDGTWFDTCARGYRDPKNKCVVGD